MALTLISSCLIVHPRFLLLPLPVQVIVSLQHGFWFKAHPQGTMQPYYKITVFASGHIKFGAWKTQYTIFNPQVRC